MIINPKLVETKKKQRSFGLHFNSLSASHYRDVFPVCVGLGPRPTTTGTWLGQTKKAESATYPHIRGPNS